MGEADHLRQGVLQRRGLIPKVSVSGKASGARSASSKKTSPGPSTANMGEEIPKTGPALDEYNEMEDGEIINGLNRMGVGTKGLFEPEMIADTDGKLVKNPVAGTRTPQMKGLKVAYRKAKLSNGKRHPSNRISEDELIKRAMKEAGMVSTVETQAAEIERLQKEIGSASAEEKARGATLEKKRRLKELQEKQTKDIQKINGFELEETENDLKDNEKQLLEEIDAWNKGRGTTKAQDSQAVQGDGLPEEKMSLLPDDLKSQVEKQKETKNKIVTLQSEINTALLDDPKIFPDKFKNKLIDGTLSVADVTQQLKSEGKYFASEKHKKILSQYRDILLAKNEMEIDRQIIKAGLDEFNKSRPRNPQKIDRGGIAWMLRTGESPTGLFTDITTSGESSYGDPAITKLLAVRKDLHGKKIELGQKPIEKMSVGQALREGKGILERLGKEGAPQEDIDMVKSSLEAIKTLPADDSRTYKAIGFIQRAAAGKGRKSYLGGNG